MHFSQNPTFLIPLDYTNSESSETVSSTTSPSTTLMTVSPTKNQAYPSDEGPGARLLDLRLDDAGEERTVLLADLDPNPSPPFSSPTLYPAVYPGRLVEEDVRWREADGKRSWVFVLNKIGTCLPVPSLSHARLKHLRITTPTLRSRSPGISAFGTSVPYSSAFSWCTSRAGAQTVALYRLKCVFAITVYS
ncbi:hypothetical protein EDB85DRAFT_2158290 [Lactarius pseudohatsudake]|nr:hypothetical protein EDB85DRAFT_2158290 [Lactarius pseudohatsudake]